MVILLAAEAVVTLRSREVGVTLLALTAILLLTAYTFRPSRPPGQADPGRGRPGGSEGPGPNPGN